MSRALTAPLSGLLAGIVFGMGLAVSQMANPEKVMAFLDVFGNWDASLLFTMASAVLITFVGYRWVLHRGPIFDGELHLPTNTIVDRRLLIGAAIFGTGWGMAGYCPGPALTGIASGIAEPYIFLIAMLAGSQMERLWLVRHPTVFEKD